PLLLMPGDSVLLGEGKDGVLSVVQSSGFSNFVDSLISIPKDFFWHNIERAQKERLEEIGVRGILHDIEGIFESNERAIAALELAEQRKGALRHFNSNIKYTGIANLLNDSEIPRSSLTDSLYSDLLLHFDEVMQVAATNNN